ncbi:tRNA (adenine57-N1/adenine58-N1)-methyltransferase [Methanolinea mesophila]|uniref:methyltransferase domain-containing protein n=1 Tax=Methanolinea mesophila TaxID=547055 RepID=UPI001AE8255A|nr:methyltransferase domain-containing protein [Methanolinea mesophila]MBP1929339.1 tRNA (adenine57-N1/adenine58-N1)-methyltransferase [Methanolinea mesophila]
MIGEGERILLVGPDRKYFVRAGSGTFSTDLGMIDLGQAVGKESGDCIESHNGNSFLILRPRAPDFFEYSKRSGAPMLPRDIGMVIAYTGMNRDDRVLDAGTGSGIAAIYFGGIAKEVTTYEVRPDFARLASANITDAGLTNVHVVADDVLNAEGTFDVVNFDMTLTRDHVSLAHRLLVPGGFLVCYTPFFEHLALVADAAGGLFSEVNSRECIEREMTRSTRGTRPSTRVCHSGYLTVARK